MKQQAKTCNCLVVEETPVLAVSGFSNTGKTYLATTLVKRFSAQGLKVAYLKHHHGNLGPDKTGSDTEQALQKGALATVLAAADGYIIRQLEAAELNFYECLKGLIILAGGPDLLLIEGYKDQPLPRIEVLIDGEKSYYENSANKPLLTLRTKQGCAVPLKEYQIEEAINIANAYLAKAKA